MFSELCSLIDDTHKFLGIPSASIEVGIKNLPILLDALLFEAVPKETKNQMLKRFPDKPEMVDLVINNDNKRRAIVAANLKKLQNKRK